MSFEINRNITPAQWLEALESDRYRHVTGTLCEKEDYQDDTTDTVGHCCLGVLQSLMGVPDEAMTRTGCVRPEVDDLLQYPDWLVDQAWDHYAHNQFWDSGPLDRDNPDHRRIVLEFVLDGIATTNDQGGEYPIEYLKGMYT